MIRKDLELNDDGTVTCACAQRLHFLDGVDLNHAPRGSVNHAGCDAAEAGASEAGPDVEGKYETINLLKAGAVEDFYNAHEWDADKRAFVAKQPAPPPAATPAATAS